MTLGNTRAVCRKCYIHPAVLAAFTSGVTLSRVTINKSRVPKGLLDAEARLVALLRRPEPGSQSRLTASLQKRGLEMGRIALS